MGSISNYSENKMLDHLTGVAAFAQPSTYLTLSTADPTDDGSGLAEHVGDNFARVQIAAWDAAAARLKTNTGLLTFNAATGAWGTLTHWAVMDSAVVGAGNMLAHGALAVAKTVVTGNQPTVAAGEVDISVNASGVAGGWCTYLCNKMLDHVFGGASYTAPAIYMAFSTTTPTDAGGNITEPSGNNYARKLHAAWAAAVGGATSNSSAITFNTPSGSWGTCTHTVALDALVAGNALFWGDVVDQEPSTGDPVDIPTGDLDLILS